VSFSYAAIRMDEGSAGGGNLAEQVSFIFSIVFQ